MDVSNIAWTNYLVPSIATALSNGHVAAEDLINKIEKAIGKEGYHGLWDLEPRKTFKDYKGLFRPSLGFFWFDFDHLQSKGDAARLDVINFVKWLDVDDVAVFFSGSKGFHVGVPHEYFGLEPSADLPKIMKSFINKITPMFKTIDTSVFDASRKFRAPGSKHPKTGLFKTRISIEDLDLSIEKIIELSSSKPNKIVLSRVSLKDKRQRLNIIEDILNMESHSRDTNCFADEDEPHSPGRCRHGSHTNISALGVALVYKNYDFKQLVKRLVEADKKLNSGADSLYFLCPSRPWNHKSVLENANDFVDEIFRNHGPGSKKESPKDKEKELLVSFNIPRIEPKIVVDKDGNEKKIMPSQAEISVHILNHFGDNVRKYDKDIFSYNGVNWTEWTDIQRTALSKAITAIFDSQTGVGRVNQIEAYVLKLMKPFKENPFVQNPFIANFLDGVLEATPNGPKYELVFREHRKEDNCLYALPFKYQIDRSIKNENFLKMIERVSGGDQNKIRQYRQMYGAILLPLYPHLFLAVGAGGTGKTAVIKCGIKLRDPGSMSFTDPTSWGSSFGLEPMLGKLVNVDLDIETHKPIADAIVKKIEDRHLFSVNRKNKKVVNAPIPAVHVFGGNKIPPTLEWGTRAHDRRWTFIEFNSFEGVMNSDRDYSFRVFAECPEGVLNFALEGLTDLIESNGSYFNSDESKKMVTDWQLANDPIGQFIKEVTVVKNLDPNLCKNGEDIVTTVSLGFSALRTIQPHVLSLSYDADDNLAVIERKKLWGLFLDWYREYRSKVPNLGRTIFYEALRAIKVKEKTIKGVRYFIGFSLKSPQ